MKAKRREPDSLHSRSPHSAQEILPTQQPAIRTTKDDIGMFSVISQVLLKLREQERRARTPVRTR